MAMAKVKIKSLFYKNECSLSFEKVMDEILSKSFSTVDKDLNERYSECQKVDKLLQCIQMLDMKVVAQKLVIVSQYVNDFLGLCNYFLAQVFVCMLKPSWRVVSIQKNIMCPLCMVIASETVVTVEDMVASVVMVGLVAAVEVGLVDEVEEVMTGQIM
jgi:hypothetical protein